MTQGQNKKDAKKKILVVEDDRFVLGLLSGALAKKGFEVIQAASGDQGLNSALKEHPDLILLDIVLPQMDGITMLKKLRLDEWGKDVPVIILTNFSNVEQVSEALESGVRDYIVKADWKLEELIKRVEEKLRE